MQRGDLGEAPVSVLLTRLAAEKSSGCLHVTRAAEGGLPAGPEALVHLRGGRVYAASAGAERFLVGTRLVTSYGVDPSAVNEAHAAQETDLTGWRVGEILVHLGYVDATVVETISREQVLEALTEIEGWRAGSWRFRPGVRTRAMLAQPMEAADAVAAIAARQREWASLQTVVGGPRAIPRLSAAPTASEALEVDADAWALLSGIDGARTVADLGRERGFSLLETSRGVSVLVGAGLVEVDGAPSETAGAASVASMLTALDEAPAESTAEDETDAPGDSLLRVSAALSALMGSEPVTEDVEVAEVVDLAAAREARAAEEAERRARDEQRAAALEAERHELERLAVAESARRDEERRHREARATAEEREQREREAAAEAERAAAAEAQRAAAEAAQAAAEAAVREEQRRLALEAERREREAAERAAAAAAEESLLAEELDVAALLRQSEEKKLADDRVKLEARRRAGEEAAQVAARAAEEEAAARAAEEAAARAAEEAAAATPAAPLFALPQQSADRGAAAGALSELAASAYFAGGPADPTPEPPLEPPLQPEPVAAAVAASTPSFLMPGQNDTASLLRELSSLGLDDDPPSAPKPPPRPAPRPAPSSDKDKGRKKKGLFGR